MDNSEYQLLGRLIAGLFIVLPMAVCALDIYLREKFDYEEDRMYRKWHIISNILAFPGFFLACEFLVLFNRCIDVVLRPESLFTPESLQEYESGIHNWIIIVFLIFLIFQFLVSIVAACYGWKYGRDHSDYEYSSWFLRGHSRVQVLDEERRIKIGWAITYYLLPKSVIVFICAFIFFISPIHGKAMVLKIANYAVPCELIELKESDKINGTYTRLDENGIPRLHWPRVNEEYFENCAESSRQYKVIVTYDQYVVKREYVFSEDGKLLSIEDDNRMVSQLLQNEVGKYAEIDKSGYFCFPLIMYDNREYLVKVTPSDDSKLVRFDNYGNKQGSKKGNFFNNASEKIFKGETVLLSSTNGSTSFYSSDTSICSVNETGHITALEFGKCQIIARSSNNSFDTCDIKVIGKDLEHIICDSVVSLIARSKHRVPYLLDPICAYQSVSNVEGEDGSVLKIIDYREGYIDIETGTVGSATITLSSENGVSAKIRINVIEDPRKVSKAINADIAEVWDQGDFYKLYINVTRNDGKKSYGHIKVCIKTELDGRHLRFENNGYSGDEMIIYKNEIDNDINLLDGAECFINDSIVDTVYLPKIIKYPAY